MKVLSGPLRFEWDKGNSDKNWKKHKVTNKESEEAFENGPKYIIRDAKHSIKEKRFQLWGRTNRYRMLNIIFTTRDNKVRVISARSMNRKEKTAYEKKV